jgi:hypothetical protein
LSSEGNDESKAEPAMPVRTLTVKSMQEAIALISKGVRHSAVMNPAGSRAQLLREGLRQFYSHTITYYQKEENQMCMYSIVFKAVNALSSSHTT